MTGRMAFTLRPRSMNARIYETLRNNPGVWMTSSDIIRIIGHGQHRGTGRRIQYMHLEDPLIECRIEGSTRTRYYRYNLEKTEHE